MGKNYSINIFFIYINMELNMDISKYTLDELREVFNLNVNYTMKDIQLNKNIVKNRLILNDSFSEKKRNKVMNFLNNAQTKLVHNILDLNKNLQPEQKKNELLCIDTKYRKNYYNTSSTNYLFDLPTTLKDVVGITLYDIVIPSSMWGINEKHLNNYFWIKKDSKWHFIRLQNGNYETKDDIKNAVNNSIQLAFQTQYIFFNINKYTKQCVFGSNDSSFNIYFNREPLDLKNLVNNTDTSFNYIKENDEPNKINKNLMQGLGWILGFRKGEYLNQNHSNKVFVSEGIYDNWNPKTLFLIIDDFTNNSNNCIISTFNDSLGKSNILARLQTNILSNTELTISNPNILEYTKRTYNGPVDINKLQIKIVDEFGRIIDLNNMDYSISLLIETIKK